MSTFHSNLFVLGIVLIFFILLMIVPTDIPTEDFSSSKQIKIVPPFQSASELAKENSSSFYNYIESIDQIKHSPESRTVEFWFENRLN